MNVIDASVAVKWFVAEPGHAEALALLESGTKLVAPDFVLVQAVSALRCKFKRSACELPSKAWNGAVVLNSSPWRGWDRDIAATIGP